MMLEILKWIGFIIAGMCGVVFILALFAVIIGLIKTRRQQMTDDFKDLYEWFKKEVEDDKG